MRIRANWFVAAAALLLIGCPGKKTAVPVAASVEGRFPHDLHRQTSCISCHDKGDVLSGKPAMPGKRDHAPCDESGCHREEFEVQDSTLCKMCHERVDPLGDDTTAAPYPPDFGPRALAAEFDHALHLDFARMELSVGFHVSCSDCHQGDEGAVGSPTHTSCARCHAKEAAPKGAPPLDECERCHIDRPKPPSRTRTLILGDLRFSHASHRADRRGQQIRCVECHATTTTHSGTGDHPVPETASCVACHDDSNRVRPTKRMRACETCHATRTARFGVLAPRSHLPATERPLDHTLAFRRDHETEALRDTERCARCHTVLSGSTRDVCDECHGTMRPLDHTVTWREYDHGQEAATEAGRCATCHAGDFCTTCHSLKPRSHFPEIEFREGGHAGPAVLNPRACATCHPQPTDCTGTGCHLIR